MAIRISTIAIPVFRDALVVGSGWTELPSRLTEAETACLVSHVGTFIQVHPEDESELTKLGLALEAGRLIEIAPVAADTTHVPTTPKKKTKE
jgi:hypothetical protein